MNLTYVFFIRLIKMIVALTDKINDKNIKDTIIFELNKHTRKV